MNPLVNVLTPRIRAIAYAALFVAGLAFAAWQAADGDWTSFVGGLITALLGATAASNASATPAKHRAANERGATSLELVLIIVGVVAVLYVVWSAVRH